MDKKNNINRTDDKNNEFEVVQLMYDEWKYRLSQYWSITSKTVLLSLVLFFIPYMKDAWGAKLYSFPDYVFPAIGIMFSAVVCYFSSSEMEKINKIKYSIKKYIVDNFPQLQNAYGMNKKAQHYFPLVIFTIQFVIGVVVFITVL